MATEARIEHRYPEALDILRRLGPDALAVLHDLAAHATRRNGILIVQASVREIAERLTFLSKDSVARRLHDLRRAEVIAIVPMSPSNVFEPPTYLLQLDGTGISVSHPRTRTA